MSRYLTMFTLVLAGELVFSLPFHLARFFRPTLLDVFSFSNTQLGNIFAVYGITAALSYFPGGVLADRFNARSLVAAALVSTSVGGLYMSTFPDATGVAVLYGYWGFTTIFLLWGALIRATREWGGDNVQGLAFGVLEGGRGVAAAAAGSIAALLFAVYLPDNSDFATANERLASLRLVIYWYSGITLVTGVLAWFAIPVVKSLNTVNYRPLQYMHCVIRRPIMWAQAAIIICAYCGYRGLDNYGLYADQLLGMNELQAAKFMTDAAWTRPLAALLAGLIADRFTASRTIGVTFAILFVSYASLSVLVPETPAGNFVFANLLLSFIAVYALRGVYFALLEENRTPKFLTGTAVGMVSFVGFTPEIFFGPITGRILDADPGLVGLQNYFKFLGAIALIGVMVVFWLMWLQRRGADELWPDDMKLRNK